MPWFLIFLWIVKSLLCILFPSMFLFMFIKTYFCTFAKITLAKAFCTWGFYWGFREIRNILCCLPALPTNCICIWDAPVFKILRLYPRWYFLVINSIAGSSAFLLKGQVVSSRLRLCHSYPNSYFLLEFFPCPLCGFLGKKKQNKNRRWVYNTTTLLQSADLIYYH